jgi:hypothetical protein
MSYHLEKIEKLPCTNEKLIIFGRAHYSYINHIFGDESVRSIIQEIAGKPGKLIVEKSGVEFENSFHHVFKAGKTKASIVCSGKEGYQAIDIDVNDTLCQSYSLMAYLDMPFDKTPSKDATVEQKYSKHMSMIAMYRIILNDKAFVELFNTDIDYPEEWIDTIDDTNEFPIITKYKTGPEILKVVERVLNVWEKYGWMYFVGDGTCIMKGGSKKTRRRRAN